MGNTDNANDALFENYRLTVYNVPEGNLWYVPTLTYDNVVDPYSLTIGNATNPTDLNVFGNITSSTTTTVGTNLQVNGNAIINGSLSANTVTTTSDYRIKQNAQKLDETFTVKYLNPVSYDNLLTKTKDIGLIAHELQEYYPELVTGEKNGPQYQKINYIGLIPILINEIKNLEKRVKKLEDDKCNCSRNH